MLKRLNLLAAVAVTLAACAPLPDLPSLPSLPVLGTRSIALGPAGGYQVPMTSVSIPLDACSADAFIEGYKTDYYLTWNQEIGTREGMYGLQLQQHPRDANAAWNLALYKGKRFNLKGYDNQVAAYGPQHLMSPDPARRCAATSYQKGKTAGTSAAMQALRKLEMQERGN